ncbi:hypothetical protein SUGI_0873600 [Cryptomeria japonica]|nr:hypothetical protein SUGI_0873600 [Cryptomeria japonica]
MSESVNYEITLTEQQNDPFTDVLLPLYSKGSSLPNLTGKFLISGVDFIEATAGDLSIADVTTAEVTQSVEQLFALNGAVNLDGHRLPLLVVQVTQLKDGISVCCTVNHAVADGISFWHFFNSWAHLCRTNGNEIPNNPIHDRCLVNPGGSVIKLGLDPDGNIPRLCPPPLRIKFFHFSAHTIRCLKDRANRDSPVVISSFQALCGHVWRAVTRARGLGPDEPTTFRLPANCRPRFVPPLPNFYFGNAIQAIWTTATVRELNSLPLSFAAGLLNAMIVGLRDQVIRERIDMWEKEPTVNRLDKLEKNSVMMGSSPRFEMYDNDFGWGRPVTVRSGMANYFDGKVSAYPGKEGGGSVDLEICLLPHFMNALETDLDFISSL